MNLKPVITQLEAERDRLTSVITQLKPMDTSGKPNAAKSPTKSHRRVMSADARQKIAKAQKARWAKVRQAAPDKKQAAAA